MEVNTMYSLHYLLMKAHTMLNKKILYNAASISLSPGQPKVLECLFLHGENNQKAIAEHCEIEQATVGTILLLMEQEGLISRFNREGDRRSLYVKLTQKGMDAAIQMNTIFSSCEKEASKHMSQEEIDELKRLLTKFCQSINDQKGCGSVD